jgi:hypothetical protein
VLKGYAVAAALSAAVVSHATTHARGQDDQVNARARASNMETLLVQAVVTGAGRLAPPLQLVAPPGVELRVDTLLIGTPEVQAFRIPDYGMQFVVRVPSMNATIAIAGRSAAASQRITMRGNASGQTQGQARAGVVATSIEPTQTVPTQPTPVRPDDPDRPLTPWDVEVLMDPFTAYRRSITDALIETMLVYGDSLRLAPNEYLMVAARRDSRPNPLNPNDIVRTLTFRISGANLDAYHQKRITRDEALKKVEITEF